MKGENSADETRPPGAVASGRHGTSSKSVPMRNEEGYRQTILQITQSAPTLSIEVTM